MRLVLHPEMASDFWLFHPPQRLRQLRGRMTGGGVSTAAYRTSARFRRPLSSVQLASCTDAIALACLRPARQLSRRTHRTCPAGPRLLHAQR